MANGKPDVYQIITDRIVSLLEKGVAPWRKTWSGGGMPCNLVSRKNYQGINVFMLGSAHYESPYWLTFRQANELGGNIRKGEHGLPVIYARSYTQEVEGDDGTVAERSRSFLRYYTVFNIEQCDGLENLPEAGAIRTYASEPVAEAEAIQLAMPNRPRVEYAGTQPCYIPAEDLVRVPRIQLFESAGEYYSALFHEMAHSTGHESRLGRHKAMSEEFDRQKYGREELVAEMASAYLCGHCGLSDSAIENSAAYLQGWIKALRGDRKLAIQAAAAAQKAANYILNVKTE